MPSMLYYSPGEKHDEGAEDLVEHRHVNVVRAQLRMPGNETVGLHESDIDAIHLYYYLQYQHVNAFVKGSTT